MVLVKVFMYVSLELSNLLNYLLYSEHLGVTTDKEICEYIILDIEKKNMHLF